MVKHKTTVRKTAKKTFKLNRFVLLVPIIIAFLIGSWLLISPQIFAPTGINEVSETASLSTSGSRGSQALINIDPQPSPLPAGCYYKQVACLVAPCPATVECSSPTPVSTTIPSNTTCRVTYPSCPSARCTADGLCEKIACAPVTICNTPSPTPTPTCIPQPVCTPGQPCAMYKMDARYCGIVVKPTPVPTCRPQPDCPPGRMCAMMVTREYCQFIKPTPTTQTGMIAAFSASGPCGGNSFKDYGYSCKNGMRNNISGCQSIQVAMTQALKVCSTIKGL